MNAEQIKALTAQYIAPTYGRFDVCLASGKGALATDTEGKKYIDFTSGIGVNSLGFADDVWATAVSKQAQTLQHTSNLFYTAPAALLAEGLCKATGLQKVFFANSGAEANEGAIKAARKYSSDKYGEGRATVVTLQNSFHGRTMATLAATGQAVFHNHFHPFPGGFKHAPTDDFAAIEAALTEDVCAVFIELVQGEGGVVPLVGHIVNDLAVLCAQKDILLLVDEVQTGMGRTGHLLACTHYGIKPDIVTLAKGLGGGLPVGAVLLGDKVQDTLNKGDHGSTYGGNPVACAGALAVLEKLDKDFLVDVRHKGKVLRAGLQKLPGVKSVDGLGLMLGIEFEEGIESAAVLQKAIDKGMLCLTAKHKLRLLPPLTITLEQISKGVAILQSILEDEAK